MNNTKIFRNHIFEDLEIYGDDYYDTINRLNYKNLGLEYGTPSTAIRCVTTLLIKAGYILIQTASIPTWNVYTLIYFNLVDFVDATLGFLCLGYFLSFGNLKQTIFSKDAKYDEAVLGWCASVFASTLVTVLLAGRLTKTAFFIIIAIVNWFIAPLFLFLIWSDNGFMNKKKILSVTVSFKDYGGCLLIHVVGSLIGFIGILVLGRRIMRLKEIYECSLGPDAPGLAVTGYFFLMIGMTLLTIPTRTYESTHSPKDYTGLILINNIIAAVGSMTIVIIFGILYQTFISYWYLLRIIQAGVAGMVMISAGSDVFTPISSFGSSVMAGIIFYWVAQYTYFSAYEDYCNIISIHLIPGIIGTIIPAIYATSDNLGFVTIPFATAIAHLVWQIICLTLSIVLVIGIFPLIFFLLLQCGCLRNSMEKIQNTRAKRILRRSTPRKCCWRIFSPKPTSTVLLPGYGSKLIFKTKRSVTPQETFVRYFPKNNYFSMFSKTMAKNPFQNEFEELNEKEISNFINDSIVFQKDIETKVRSPRTKFTAIKSNSEPLLDVQSLSIITHRRHSTTETSNKSNQQHKIIQRPWNIHEKTRLYGLKRSPKRFNITFESIEKYNTVESIADNNYSEVINLNDETVKIIKNPININDYYESISESEI